MTTIKTPIGTIKATETELVLAEMVFKASVGHNVTAAIMDDWRDGFTTSTEAMAYIIRLAKGRAKARKA